LIDSDLNEKGELNYGEIYLPGESKEELTFSTLICHPSMANNEMSGMIFNTFLALLISKQKNRKLSYRFLFLPETIGSISYLDRMGDYLKEHCIGGFMITCLGKKSDYLYLKKSRDPSCKINKIVKDVLDDSSYEYREANFNPSWGCDERQFSSPGINLPFVTLSSLMFGECQGYDAPSHEDYLEYHTSLDDRSNIDFSFMASELGLYLDICSRFENQLEGFKKESAASSFEPPSNTSPIYQRRNPKYEPFMSNSSFYPTLSGSLDNDFRQRAMWVLNYADGLHDLAKIESLSGFSQEELQVVADVLIENNLIT
ncbi:DUF4910 domain-containing protein, partial [bacterium]|nr:DUF4910 domain-containing protein [bacterium]